MKATFITILSILCYSLSPAQITISNTAYTPSQLVDGILVPTGTTPISNITYRGVYNVSSRYQIGYFTTATSTQAQLGFSSGLVLTTGNTSDIPLSLGTDPGSVVNISRSYTSCTAGEIRNSGTSCQTVINDLVVLMSPENYYNATIIEFDFIPSYTDLYFRYVFASEEYDQEDGAFSVSYNCSAYNDKFAFLLSGPGISGGQGYTNDAVNIARLNNGSEVAINSVNNGTVGSYGGSPNASNCLAANPDWVNGTPTAEFYGKIDGIAFNGNTKPLHASYAGLTPGATYHIRLMIADAKDGAYDSAVFLEAASFSTSSGTLPVELINAQGTCTPKGSLLSWTTATENNNSHFIVEKLNDFGTFDVIGTVTGAGNASSARTYFFTDPSFSSSATYRLAQEDFDGNQHLFKVIQVQKDCSTFNDTFITHYDDNSGELTIELTEDMPASQIEIYDSMGQIIFNISCQGGNHEYIKVPFVGLTKGLYMVSLHTEGYTETVKILNL